MERRVRVAVPGPFPEGLDYLAGDLNLMSGARVRVPLGRRAVMGVVLDPPRDVEPDGLACRAVEESLDPAPLVPPSIVSLVSWVARYYHHAVGDVFAAALPAPARRMASKAAARRRRKSPDTAPEAAPRETPPAATPSQAAALEALEGVAPGFSVALLEGVTGSGKTEVYLRRVERVLGDGGQVLVLTPEIGLTPQLVERFERRFGSGVAAFHSGLTDATRASHWHAAREGRLGVLIGTRSAVFVPMPNLKLVIVDEEHDASFKQQDGLRYSARDVAIVRAREAGIPVMLGSATPSLESRHNARRGRYLHLSMASRVAERRLPRTHVLDVRRASLEHGLSEPMLEAIARHREQGRQSMLFVNRRGYAPVLMCHECGWIAPCPHCDARMTLHRTRGRLVCHHCATEALVPARCERCSATPLTAMGQGTERVEDALRVRFPGARVERLDSDRTAKVGELERLLAEARDGKIDILVGTQMLAKGHDFANVTMVGVVTADQALFSADFRAMERLGQLLTQVAGRAGRGDAPGEVFLQTHQPDHPLLRVLLAQGYPAFADALLEERKAFGLPPFAHLALLRADALDADKPLAFLARVAEACRVEGVEVLGPVPAPMERRAGRVRAQLLLRSMQRAALHALLDRLVHEVPRLPGARQVRWSIDVDPTDLY
ncbi:MAG TPA: primosomal protein N' [Nevskiaceae bacterium]|nr:primosomal protein N' [Nevskiaceae bacterium]